MELSRSDFLAVGQTSRALRVLPLGSRQQQQRVVVGNAEGNILCFHVRRREATVAWNTHASDNEIACLTLGTIGGKEKIWTASRQIVSSFTKKGRKLNSFDTNLTEQIRALVAEEETLWVGGEFVYTQFVDGIDSHFFMADDIINDVAAEHISDPNTYDAVLGCQDSYVRIVQGSELLNEAPVEGPVSAVTRYRRHAGVLVTTEDADADRQLIYGTQNGFFGQLLASPVACRRSWCLEGEGGVSCIGVYDMTSDGIPDLLIGRDNGLVQLFGLDSSLTPRLLFETNLNESITAIDGGIVTTPSFHEIVLSTYSGKVLSFSSEPVVDNALEITPVSVLPPALEHPAATASAQPVAPAPVAPTRTLEPLAGAVAPFPIPQAPEEPKPEAHVELPAPLPIRPPSPPPAPRVAQTPEAAAAAKQAAQFAVQMIHQRQEQERKKIQHLSQEIQKMRERLEKLQDRYVKKSNQLIAVQSQMKLRSTLSLNPSDATHTLVVEAPLFVACVALQSDVPMEVHSLPSAIGIVSVSKSTAPVASSSSSSSDASAEEQPAAPPQPTAFSFSPNDRESSRFLATIRCHPNVSRVEIKLRLTEGHAGTLQAYVIPSQSIKTCHVASHTIRPLSLHKRVPRETLADPTRPMSELRVTGEFQLGEAHSWVQMCLPDVPNRHAQTQEEIAFLSTFSGTILVAQYRRGEGVYRSDSVSTIATLKEYITKAATERKSRISVSCNVNTEAVNYALSLISPKLSSLLTMTHNYQLIECLKEIQMQEGEVDFLEEEHREILKDPEAIQQQHANKERVLNYLLEILSRLYVDKFKLSGINVAHRLPMLKELVNEYDHQQMVQFFAQRD